MSEAERSTAEPTVWDSAGQRGPGSRARQSRLAAAGAAVGLVIVAVAVMAVAKATEGDPRQRPWADPRQPRPGVSAASAPAGGARSQSAETAVVVAAVTGVPTAVFDKVGRGKIDVLPKPLKNQPALRDGDKPLVIFVGSETCPHCASQRWAVAAALSRFGKFTGLTTSPHNGGTPKFLSFHGATFTSEYLAFEAAELASSDGLPLDELTPRQNEVMDRYGTGGVPFLDLGNRYVMIGSAYSAALMSGKTALQVAEALDDPDDPVAEAIVGGANALTAAICVLTGQQPSRVCSSPAARAYAGEF